jgi:hypothetical protein
MGTPATRAPSRLRTYTNWCADADCRRWQPRPPALIHAALHLIVAAQAEEGLVFQNWYSGFHVYAPPPPAPFHTCLCIATVHVLCGPRCRLLTTIRCLLISAAVRPREPRWSPAGSRYAPALALQTECTPRTHRAQARATTTSSQARVSAACRATKAPSLSACALWDTSRCASASGTWDSARCTCRHHADSIST